MVYQRHALTLIEMMLVIVLVGVVGSALALNLRGALDKGRSFKTQETKKKIETVLNIAQLDQDVESLKSSWETEVIESPLVKISHKDKTILDAWGNKFDVDYDPNEQQFFASSLRIDKDGNIITPNKSAPLSNEPITSN